MDEFMHSPDLLPFRRLSLAAHRSPTGLELFSSRCTFDQVVDVELEDSDKRVHLSVWLDSGMEILDGPFRQRIESYQTFVGYLPGARWLTRLHGRVHHVGVMFRRSTLESLGVESVSDGLENHLRGGPISVRTTDPQTLRVAFELDQALHSPVRDLLMCEAKGIELLARLTSDSRSQDSDLLSSRERDQLHHAREMLLADIANAPSLAVLARACGLNELKLKRGFKKVFGQPVYRYYQQQRLTHAWQLLEKGKCNVSSAAYAVGYSNVSHFISAFRSQFGMPPSVLKRGSSTPVQTAPTK